VEPSTNDGFPRAWARAAFALDLRSLAVYRVALGTILVADCLLRTRDFQLMHTATGMFTPEAIRAYGGGAACWSLAGLSDADAWAAGVLGLEGLAGGLLAVGCCSRAATVAAWVAVVSIVRRTAPATNAGDAWLVCQLAWACFLPLGARWSCDARRHAAARGGSRARPSAAWSVATVALVLQVVFVYLAAGGAKCNPGWWSGEALGHVLSVHDHGTALGMSVAEAAGPLRLVTRLVPVFELAGAVLVLALPLPLVRGLLVVAFTFFHIGIWATMSVGLFAPIAIAAWLPLVPARWWEQPAGGAVPTVGLGRPAAAACAAALALASTGYAVVMWHPPRDDGARPLPAALDALLDLTALHQEWGMFGSVPAQEQWVIAAATLADGRVVDLLRGGAPVATVPPPGGFATLPHHRWQSVLWTLHTPPMRVFAPGVAAALARRWTATHPDGAAVRTLEIRFGRRRHAPGDGTVHELLVATWPDRSATGAGGLERLLEEDATRAATLDEAATVPRPRR